MSRAGLVGVHRRRLRGCTRRDPARFGYPDLVLRDFTATAPNQLWVATSPSTPPVRAGPRPGLREHGCLRRPAPGLIHHSDHGSQYTSLAFSQRLQEAGILGSMGSVGDALDNAIAESFFATLQTELLNQRYWPTRQMLRSAIFEFVEVFYNRHRLHSALGYLSPGEFERRWHLEKEPAIT